MKNRCFICNISRIEFQKNKIDIGYHRKYEHNTNNYIKFFVFLWNIDEKDMECAILKVLDLDCLVSTSVYDFCKTYFYDFYYNNKSLITTKEDVKIYKYIKYTSIYLNKLVLCIYFHQTLFIVMPRGSKVFAK